MRIGRIATARGAAYVRSDDDVLMPIEDPFRAFAEGRPPRDLDAPLTGEILPPCEPLAIIGIAQNGPDHASPVQAWLKNPRTLIASGRTVALRRDAGTPAAEAEIAVVIGRDSTGLTAANAHEYVLGLTAVNDLSSPDRAAFDPRNFEGKAGDGYTPLGPWIDTEASIDTASLELIIDGESIVRTGATDLPVPIRECLAYVASWGRLGPGDVVMTGAPLTNRAIAPGSVVDVVVSGVRLTTPTA